MKIPRVPPLPVAVLIILVAIGYSLFGCSGPTEPAIIPPQYELTVLDAGGVDAHSAFVLFQATINPNDTPRVFVYTYDSYQTYAHIQNVVGNHLVGEIEYQFIIPYPANAVLWAYWKNHAEFIDLSK